MNRLERQKKEKEKILKELKIKKGIDNFYIIDKLVDKASFLLILSIDMETQLNDIGFTSVTINASQEFTKANPLLKEYRETVKSYQATLKQLNELIDNKQSNDIDELKQFIETS